MIVSVFLIGVSIQGLGSRVNHLDYRNLYLGSGMQASGGRVCISDIDCTRV